MHLHKSVLVILSLLCFGMLSACASTSQPAASVATNLASRHTIAVPAADDMLARALRDRLSARGWSLIQYDANALQDSRGYLGLAHQARYRLTLSNRRIGDCRSGEASFVYNVALIENQSGDVLMGLTGADCRGRVLKRFDTTLDRKHLDPEPSPNEA